MLDQPLQLELLDTFSDQYPEIFDEARKVTSGAPSNKQWRRLCVQLDSWAKQIDEQEQRDVLLLYLRERISTWYRYFTPELPDHWRRAFSQGKPCWGLGLFTSLNLHAATFGASQPNARYLSLISSLTINVELRYDAQAMKRFFGASSWEALTSLTFTSTRHTRERPDQALDAICEHAMPSLRELRASRLSISSRTLERWLESAWCPQLDLLALTFMDASPQHSALLCDALDAKRLHPDLRLELAYHSQRYTRDFEALRSKCARLSLGSYYDRYDYDYDDDDDDGDDDAYLYADDGWE